MPTAAASTVVLYQFPLMALLLSEITSLQIAPAKLWTSLPSPSTISRSTNSTSCSCREMLSTPSQLGRSRIVRKRWSCIAIPVSSRHPAVGSVEWPGTKHRPPLYNPAAITWQREDSFFQSRPQFGCPFTSGTSPYLWFALRILLHQTLVGGI